MSTKQLDNLLSAFEPISLSEMDNVKLMNRVDTKFLFSREKLLEILPELAEHYRILKINDILLPSYESIYYDDKDLNFYVNHHRKRLDRFKVRYRKYVESDIAFLEVKHKNKGRTDKNRIPVAGLPDKMSDEDAKFVFSTGVPKQDLIEVLANRFNRITLVAKHINERLTLDLNLSFKLDGKEEVLENIVIAELKQANASRISPFYSLMKGNLIRPNRVSKYCIGIIKTHGKENVKYNRFKKKLLKINKLQNNA